VWEMILKNKSVAHRNYATVGDARNGVHGVHSAPAPVLVLEVSGKEPEHVRVTGENVLEAQQIRNYAGDQNVEYRKL